MAKKEKKEEIISPEEKKAMLELINQHSFNLPNVGDKVEAKVIAISKNEVMLDIKGEATGIVRGPELFDESGEYGSLKIGDEVTATILELENEKGLLELSFRAAGHLKAWEQLEGMLKDKKVVEADVIDANKGGLLVRVGRINGFLPVSQLTMEHYPRVEGGNKARILDRLQSYIGKKFKVRLIAVDEKEDKLIVSERQAYADEQKKVLDKYKINDVVEGRITGVVDFGAFIEFGEGDDKLEGLVHISELAWQRIDNPKEIVQVGDVVKAQIISIEDGRISLSIRRLKDDPWKGVEKKYKAGQVVKGKVLKTNPFGAFVELDRDIHGLIHISELSWDKVSDPRDVVKVGEDYELKILSIEPKEHRLGLSLKALQKRPKSALPDKEEPKEEKESKIV